MSDVCQEKGGRARDELLESALDAVTLSVLLLDRGGRIVHANRHFLQRIGRSAAETVGLSAWDLVPAPLVEAARLPAKLEAALRGGTALPQGERVTFRGPGLPTRILWYRLAPVPHAGRTDHAILVLEDVTALERASADVRNALQAQRLAALGVFVAGLAHELRNPLAISSSAAQLLAEGGLSAEDAATCLKRVRVGIDRANRVIQALAALAPAAPRAERERLPLAELVLAPASWVEAHAMESGVRVVLSVPEEPCTVEGERGPLEQAVFALLLNAVQAMPEGGTLRVTARLAGEEAVLRVEDTGTGLPAGAEARVFDPFFTTRPPGEGTGLGLPLCYATVTGHGGTVTVERGRGRGTVATVRLPLCPGAGSGG